MHLALVIFGLSACTIGDTPSFPGGGTSNLPTDDSGIDSGDTGEPVASSTPQVTDVGYEWEEFPNSDTGWALHLTVEVLDAEGDLVGGEITVWLGEQNQSFEIDPDADPLYVDVDEDGNLLMTLSIEDEDADMAVKVKDAAGNASDKYEFEVLAP